MDIRIGPQDCTSNKWSWRYRKHHDPRKSRHGSV